MSDPREAVTRVIDHVAQSLSSGDDALVLLLGRPARGRAGLQLFPLLIVSARESCAGEWLAAGEVHMRKSWDAPHIESCEGAPANAARAIQLACARAVERWQEQLSHEGKTREHLENRRAALRAAQGRLAALRVEIATIEAAIAVDLANLPVDEDMP